MVRLQTLGELRLGGEGVPALSTRRRELVPLTYRLVGEELGADGEQVWLESDAVDLDAAHFEQEVDAGLPEEAAARWHGDFLAGAEEVGGEELRTCGTSPSTWRRSSSSASCSSMRDRVEAGRHRRRGQPPGRRGARDLTREREG
jgi:hypothetical protein